MDINYFEQMWSKKKTDKSASRAFWDSRAEEFNQRVCTGEGEKRLNKILELFASKGMLTSESKVLDIGCGPGKYAIQFAKIAKSVTGVDVAPRMIECANGNASAEKLSNTEFKVSDWEEIDISSLGWEKKFDLVFASMCPAINSKSALEKMVSASRGYCFLSSFVERTDEIKDYLSKYIVGQYAKGGLDDSHKLQCSTMQSGFGKAIYLSFNILWLMGFYPEITYIDTEWEHVMPVNKAAEFFCAHFEMTQKLNSEQRAFIQNYLEQIAENGNIKEKVKAKIAWMNWKV